MPSGFKLHEHDSPAEIITLLTRVVRARACVTIKSQIGVVVAVIDSVHLTGPYLALVSEAPQDRLRALSACDSLLFEIGVGSARLEFNVAGTAIQFADEGNRLLVGLPSRMLRVDRREHYRIALGGAKAVRCDLRFGDESVYTAEAHDLSVGGIGLTVRGLSAGVISGDVLPRCRLRLPRSAEITVDIEIRHRVEELIDQTHQVSRLGCRFLNLHEQEAALIRRFLNELE